MGHVLGAGTQLEDGKNLGAGINRQPEPLHLCLAAQPGAQFVQLEVWEPQMAEGPLVQGLCVLASVCEPCGDGGLTGAEDACSSRWVQPFGQRGQYHGDSRGRGFQSVQGGIAPGSERGAARLTPKGLDL